MAAMGDDTQAMLRGEPVALDVTQVEAALADLWGSSAAMGVARATSLTLVTYLDRPDDLPSTRAAVRQLMEAHPLRAVYVLCSPDRAQREVTAGVAAFCRLGEVGHICCEEITLSAGCVAWEALPSAVAALRADDLPLCVWWRAPLRRGSRVFRRATRSADRLIADAAACAPEELPRQLETLALLARGSRRVGDLAWHRLTPARRALADAYDRSPDRALFHAPRSLTLRCADAPAEACLLLGWLASRLGWRLHEPDAEDPHVWVFDAGGNWLTAEVSEAPGHPAGVREVRLARGRQAIALPIEAPAADELAHTLDEELDAWAPDPIYAAAVHVAAALAKVSASRCVGTHFATSESVR